MPLAVVAPPRRAWLTWPPRVWAEPHSDVEAGDGFPPGLWIALGALLVFGLAGGGGALVRSRRSGPEPAPQVAAAETDNEGVQELDARGVEAALQELIAEQRAHHMLTPPASVEPADTRADEIGAPP